MLSSKVGVPILGVVNVIFGSYLAESFEVISAEVVPVYPMQAYTFPFTMLLTLFMMLLSLFLISY